MELKLGDLVHNFNRSSKILYAHRSSNALYWLPKQITSYHWLFKMRAKRAAASVSTKERQKKFSGQDAKIFSRPARPNSVNKYIVLHISKKTWKCAIRYHPVIYTLKFFFFLIQKPLLITTKQSTRYKAGRH